MSTAWIIIFTIVGYFALLFLISWITGRNADNQGFFIGNRKSPWFMVMLSMIAAGLTGATFISVPGTVAQGSHSYMQMSFGFFVGAVIIAYVLIPLFYKMNLLSIYGYLEHRFGLQSYRTGAWFFLVSKIIGSSVKFYVVCLVLQTLAFDALQVPFSVNVILTVSLIWLYSFQGGVKSLIWTDALKTLCLIGSVVACVVFIAVSFDMDSKELFDAVYNHPTSRVFFFDDVNDGRYFWKQFIAGIFMIIATTGLDQDLMQRILSCENYKDSQKNMVISLFIQVLIIGLFLVLGTLLYLYVERYPEYGINVQGDALFCEVAWSKECPLYIGVIFILGLIASSYSAAASALTSLTTSFTVDILKADVIQTEKDLTLTRKLVHIMMSLIMVVIIMIFYEVKSDSAINAVFSLASYTYGPIVGMFIFGLACSKKVKDRWVPLVTILSPLLSYLLKSNSEQWFNGYQISFELLIINALFTVLGLSLLIERKKV